jgi:crotonobetainyl-CoA:carnitine CoA-transferase CaiB-like acyl-CoA transferase
VRFVLLAPFVRVGGARLRRAAPAPSLGADTESVLAELR